MCLFIFYIISSLLVVISVARCTDIATIDSAYVIAKWWVRASTIYTYNSICVFPVISRRFFCFFVPSSTTPFSPSFSITFLRFKCCCPHDRIHALSCVGRPDETRGLQDARAGQRLRGDVVIACECGSAQDKQSVKLHYV